MEKETKLKRIGKMHINFNEWAKYAKYAKAVGIKTFSELEMYCRIWNIHNEIELGIQLCNDYLEYLYTKGV